MEFEIDGEYIELNKLLKASAIVESGGVAGLLIKEGEILVDGEVETRKKCKIRPGQIVSFDGEEILVVGDE